MKQGKSLSIIFPTLNSSILLDKVLKKLESQTFTDFKILIVDGGSKDDTLEKFNSSFLDTEVISEYDKSFNDGVSKSLQHIKTSYFMIIGDDDEISDENYLKKLMDHIILNKSDIVFPEYGEIIGKNYFNKKQPKNFDSIYTKVVVPGIGWIANKKIIGHADFDTNLIASSDYDFLLKLYKKGFKFSRCIGPRYYFRIGANSYINAMAGFKERTKISIKHGAPKITVYLNYLIICLKFILKYKILSHIIKKYRV